MTKYYPVYIKDPEIFDRFQHYAIDNGKKPDVAISKLLDIADGIYKS